MVYTIQNESFWQAWRPSEEDMDRLLEIFLEQGRPLTLDDMARALVERMVDELKIQRGGEADAVYDPTLLYEVGTRLRFPRLNNIVGEVVGVRTGDNPRYEHFSVLRVKFAGHPDVREFVADFHHLHALNFEPHAAPEELSAEAIYSAYRATIHERLEAALGASEEFVRFGDVWLPKALVVDINVGNRNIAEAMIDVMGKALPPEELLTEMEISDEVGRPILIFSVNHALAQDERFVNRGSEQRPLWYLRRLEEQ
ncbi:MAG: hypothetical protein Q9O62_12505 [Ardenticatenia bacterium]|nr:hypothetical protein [Ardenticatenia bacterium]